MATMVTEAGSGFVLESRAWRCPKCENLTADQPQECARCRFRQDGRVRWWRYVVLRGAGVPAELDGRWYDLDSIPSIPGPYDGVVLDATNRWEQRDDGAVAVVYEWTRR